MNSHKWSLLLVCAVLLCSLPGHFAQRSKKKLKFCKLDMLLECAIEPNSRFTSVQNGSGIVNSQEEMEQFCFNLVDYTPLCAKQWLKRCASAVHKEGLERIFLDQMPAAMNVFCDPAGPVRNEFLKYSTCLIFDVKLAPEYRKECVRPLQAANEFIHERAMQSPNFTHFLRNTCCAFNKWEGCILDHLTRKCGKPSADVFPYLIHQFSLKLLRSFCDPLHYNPNNPEQCDPPQFIAPEDYKPKGLHSSSVISYIFSYSCPNVGWGIVPQRDW